MADTCQNMLSRARAGLVALLVVVGAGCDDPPPDENQPPVAQGTILDMTLEPGDEESVNVASYFKDPDGDVLTYTASSATESVATVATSGSRLTVTAVATGTSEVTVTATDPDGESAQQKFTVTVEPPNRPPSLVFPYPVEPIEYTVGQSSEDELNGRFTDPDGDDLTFSAESSDPSIASERVSGSTLIVTAQSVGGPITITVTATDPEGLSASGSFQVVVVEEDS